MTTSTTKTHSDTASKTQSYKYINNSYTRSRGEPQMYSIFCGKCEELVLIYQKDGKGQLLRCYFDRIHYPEKLPSKEKLTCQTCQNLIGTKMIYKPENRPAFRMIKDNYHIIKGLQ
jgi:hypothetical protein